MASRQRIAFLDYTKGIGMLMIILAHTSHHVEAVYSYQWIPQSFHVPLFFLAVGIVHAFFPPKGDVKAFIKKRLWALIIPYIVFSLINSILKLGGLFAMHQLDSSAFYDEMFQLFINGNGPVWFLATLFFTDCLYILTRNNVIGGVISIICATTAYLIGDCNNEWIYPFIRIIAAYPLIYIGACSKYLFTISAKKRCISMAILFALWIALVSNPENYYAFRPGFFNNPLHSIPLMLSGSYAFILLSTFIPSGFKPLEYIGKNSLAFLLIHPTLELMYSLSCSKFVDNMNSVIQVGIFIVLFISILIICWIINELILKYCPIILGKRLKK